TMACVVPKRVGISRSSNGTGHDFSAALYAVMNADSPSRVLNPDAADMIHLCGDTDQREHLLCLRDAGRKCDVSWKAAQSCRTGAENSSAEVDSSQCDGHHS